MPGLRRLSAGPLALFENQGEVNHRLVQLNIDLEEPQDLIIDLAAALRTALD